MIFSSSYKQSMQSIIKDGIERTCITTQRNGGKTIKKCFTRRLRRRKGKGTRKRRKKGRKKKKRKKKKRTRRKRK